MQEFVAWQPHDGLRYELVDGVPRAMARRSTVHGFLQAELGRLIRNHPRESGSHCLALTSPGVAPHLMASHNIRIPDLAVTCLPLVPGQMTLSDPLLLVEILSPSDQAETRSNIWTYASIPSVREIVILHSTRVAAEALRRNADASWPQQPELATNDELVLACIDFRSSLSELYGPTGLA